MTRPATPDPDSFLPLHPLDLRILLVVSDGAAHGYRIVGEIERREPGHRRIYPANLYRRLRDLLERGLLREAPVPTDHDGRRQRYFRLTPLGRAVAAAEVRRMEQLLDEARASDLASGT